MFTPSSQLVPELIATSQLEPRGQGSARRMTVIRTAKARGDHGVSVAKNATLEVSGPPSMLNRVKWVMAKNAKLNMEREEPNSAMRTHVLKILMALLAVQRTQPNAWHAREVLP